MSLRINDSTLLDQRFVERFFLGKLWSPYGLHHLSCYEVEAEEGDWENDSTILVNITGLHTEQSVRGCGRGHGRGWSEG